MALGLLLLAPTVGEYLLGNIPISQYGDVLFLLPLYGAGALLVRESARRLGRGWPTIVLLAAAYAVIEEGPVDQMIFNPGYLGLPSFAGYAEIPGLGISGSLLLWSLALHTVWSICVPIALVEAFDPTPTLPWLGRLGLVVTAVAVRRRVRVPRRSSRRRTSTSSAPPRSSRSPGWPSGPRRRGVPGRRPPADRAPPGTRSAAVARRPRGLRGDQRLLAEHRAAGRRRVGGAGRGRSASRPQPAVAPGWSAGGRGGPAGTGDTGSPWRRVPPRRTPPGSGPSQAAEAGTGPVEAAWGAVVFGLALPPSSSPPPSASAASPTCPGLWTLGVVRDVSAGLPHRKHALRHGLPRPSRD